MTTELQRAMARYEEARILYKKAVLGSLNGAANGDAIRRAIQEFQSASAELKRVTAAPSPRARSSRQDEAVSSPSWNLFRRFLKAG